MENNKKSSRGIAATGAIIGGLLLALNTTWQGYLDLTPGNDQILHDVNHLAYFLNVIMLFIAMFGLIIGLLSLNKLIKKTKLWQTGVFLSVVGQGLFAIGSLAFIIHGLINLGNLLDIVDAITGISNLVMYLGALPLGIVLLRQQSFPRASSILFILTIPSVIVAMALVYNMNALIGGLLTGGVYGLAWVIAGLYLRKAN